MEDAGVKDSDLQEARRCLANEETGKAIELYETMRKRGEHEAEADLAVKICKYYDACKSGVKDDISASEADLFLRIKSVDTVDTEFALAFPQLVAKAFTLRIGPGGYTDWRKFFTWKFWAKDTGELQQLPNGLEANECEFYEPAGQNERGRKLVRVIAGRNQARFEIAEISRNIFFSALDSDEFAMLSGDAKRRLEFAAAELDGHYVFLWGGRGDTIPQDDEQMSDIYRRLGLRDARDRKDKYFSWSIIFCYIALPVAVLCLFLFIDYCAKLSIYFKF